MSYENKCENTTFNLQQENQPELPVEKRQVINSAMETKQGENISETFATESAMNCQGVKENSSITAEGEKVMESIKGATNAEAQNKLNDGCVENENVLHLNCPETVTKDQEDFSAKGIIDDKNKVSTTITKTESWAEAAIKKESTVNEADLIKNIKIHINNHPLRTVSLYDSDSSSSSDIPQFWKDNILDCSEGTSSGTEEEEGEMSLIGIPRQPDVVESQRLPGNTNNRGAIKKNPPVNNDVELDNLPPVPDISTLCINGDNEKFIHMGHIMGIVGRIVTVEAIANQPAYDLDTVLFLDNGKRPLGFIFDVLGQVSAPIYAIRFNSIDDIKQVQVTIGMKVYSAPNSQHTQYVFMQQLLKMKGSDASWEEDVEVPAEFADYSDDEAEVTARRCHSSKKRSHPRQQQPAHQIQEQQQQEEQDFQYKRFETAMNRRNILNTKFSKYMDSYRHAKTIIKNSRQFRHHVDHQHHHNHFHPTSTLLQSQQQQQQQLPQQLPPEFNPTIPPPNLIPPQHAHYLANPPSTFLPPEFLSSLSNNNSSDVQFEPLLGAFVNVNQRQFLLNNIQNTTTNSSDNYFTNNAGKDHPGPSHE